MYASPVCENFGADFFCWQVVFLIFFHGVFTPKPPTAERGGANFWCLPQLTAPLFLATDERYGFVKIPRGARGGMGACPHNKNYIKRSSVFEKGVRSAVA